MDLRTKIVTSILAVSRRLVATDQKARDANRYAEMARDLDDHEAAAVLRSSVVALKSEAMAMRALMSKLATALAAIPVETD